MRTIRAVLPAGLFLFCVGCPGGPSRIDLPAEVQVLGERAATRDGRTSLVVVTARGLRVTL